MCRIVRTTIPGGVIADWLYTIHDYVLDIMYTYEVFRMLNLNNKIKLTKYDTDINIIS